MRFHWLDRLSQGFVRGHRHGASRRGRRHVVSHIASDIQSLEPRVLLAASPAGAEFHVNTTTVDEQTNPVVAMDSVGNYVVVWESTGQDQAFSLGVYGQLYNAAGAKVGAEFLVNTFT